MHNWGIFMRLVSRPLQFSHWPLCVTRILRLLQLSASIASPKRLPRSALPKDTTTKVVNYGKFHYFDI